MAIVFHNGRLHLLNTSSGDHAEMPLADVRGQGDISGVSFTPQNTMLVADRVQRVSEYELGSFKLKRSVAPPLTGLEIAYYYAVVPIYTVFPKPTELDNTVQYLLKGKETTDLGLFGADLQAKRPHLHPWAPVQSSLIFVVVLLAAACFYIERQDF